MKWYRNFTACRLSDYPYLGRFSKEEIIKISTNAVWYQVRFIVSIPYAMVLSTDCRLAAILQSLRITDDDNRLLFPVVIITLPQ